MEKIETHLLNYQDDTKRSSVSLFIIKCPYDAVFTCRGYVGSHSCLCYYHCGDNHIGLFLSFMRARTHMQTHLCCDLHSDMIGFIYICIMLT